VQASVHSSVLSALPSSQASVTLTRPSPQPGHPHFVGALVAVVGVAVVAALAGADLAVAADVGLAVGGAGLVVGVVGPVVALLGALLPVAAHRFGIAGGLAGGRRAVAKRGRFNNRAMPVPCDSTIMVSWAPALTTGMIGGACPLSQTDEALALGQHDLAAVTVRTHRLDVAAREHQHLVARLEQLAGLTLARPDDADRLEHLRDLLDPKQDVVGQDVHRPVVAEGPVVLDQEQPIHRVQAAVVVADQQGRAVDRDAIEVADLEAVVSGQLVEGVDRGGQRRAADACSGG
jgi:hypothetical protein